jgi:hypothetical protein
MVACKSRIKKKGTKMIKFYLFNSAPDIHNDECIKKGKDFLCELIAIVSNNKRFKKTPYQLTPLCSTAIQTDDVSCGFFVCAFGEKLATCKKRSDMNAFAKQLDVDIAKYKKDMFAFLDSNNKPKQTQKENDGDSDSSVEFIAEQALSKLEVKEKDGVVDNKKTLKSEQDISDKEGSKADKMGSTADKMDSIADKMGPITKQIIRKVKTKPSTIKGADMGLFADEEIKKGELFLKMEGVYINKNELSAKYGKNM